MTFISVFQPAHPKEYLFQIDMKFEWSPTNRTFHKIVAKPHKNSTNGPNDLQKIKAEQESIPQIRRKRPMEHAKIAANSHKPKRPD